MWRRQRVGKESQADGLEPASSRSWILLGRAKENAFGHHLPADNTVVFRSKMKREPVRWKGTGPGRHPADRAQVIRIRTNLSMVFQQFNLWSHLSVLQNVMEAPMTLDQLVQQLDQPTGEILATLVQLELMGLVTQLPGMRYQRP
jgi:predicted Rossmann fold nucleotide-binding protein DprA/Smf involved in DNA uptake